MTVRVIRPTCRVSAAFSVRVLQAMPPGRTYPDAVAGRIKDVNGRVGVSIEPKRPYSPHCIPRHTRHAHATAP